MFRWGYGRKGAPFIEGREKVHTRKVQMNALHGGSLGCAREPLCL